MTKVLFVVCVLFVFSSCGKTDDQQPSETATTGSFELVADEVLKPVIDSLVQGFMLEAPTAKVTVKYVSAGEAVRLLMNHQTRAIIIDRYLTPQEQAVLAKDSVTLPEFRMAEDGIGVITNISELSSIRLSEIRNWIQGKGKYGFAFSKYPSSIEYMIDSFAGLSTPAKSQEYESSDLVIGAVSMDPRTLIGFVSSAWIHEIETWRDSNVNMDVKVLAVIPHDLSSQGISEPVLLHIAYIAEKAYPLRTMVMGYTQEPANTVPRGFFAYCMTSHGQNTFKNFGILPKTQNIKLVPSGQ